jgi:hypothetical protein
MAFEVFWNLAGTETGQAAQQVDANDRSVHVDGTLGGGSVTIEGSNDNISWFTLNDPQGNPLVFSSPRIECILEMTAYIRARSTGVTAAKVSMYVRGQVN